jgi:hypothetical protein
VLARSHDHCVNDGIDDNKDDDDKDDNKDEDDKTSKVYTIKRDVSLGSYGEAFLLGIYGLFFSIVFHWKLIYHVQNDLEFCQCPTSRRMLRVSLRVHDSLFLLSIKV